MKSIREFADELRISHTELRRIIQKVETSEGIRIGKSQGRGKPIFLSQKEQDRLRQELKPKNVEIVHVVPDAHIEVMPENTYLAPTTNGYLETQLEQAEVLFARFKQNREACEEALLSQMEVEGTQLGVQMFNRKYGKALRTFDTLEKKQNDA